MSLLMLKKIAAKGQAMSEPSPNNQIKPRDFKVGMHDNDGNKIRMIYTRMPEYVVYRTDSAIRIDIDDDCGSIKDYLANHHRIGIDLARIYSWLPQDLSWSEAVNKQIARAIATNVAGNFADAKEMLRHAEERIINLKTIQGRLQYTLSAFAIVVPVFLISLFLSGYKSSIYSNVILCGALGGVLSVAVGFRNLEIDIDSNWQTNSLIGGSRILIAITASLFSYFAIKSEIAFSFVENTKEIAELPTENYGIYLIAMVAGFAEMLVPNIMNNLAKENTQENEKNQAT